MPPLPTTLLSCSGRGSITNGSIGTVGGLSRMMLRAEVGEVLRAGRLELARRADLVGRVAGHHLVDGGRVVEQAVGRVAHGRIIVNLSVPAPASAAAR